MAESSQTGAGLASNGFVWLLLVAAGSALLNRQLPVEDIRPPSKIEEEHADPRGNQDVDARLWQDPIAAVNKALAEDQRKQKDRPNLRPALHPPSNVWKAVAPAAAPDKTRDNVTVLAVFLPGGPYANDSEARRRFRYATLAGLNASGFTPSDEQHLGYFTPKPDGRADDGKNPLPAAVPFEGFASNNGRAVVVLWLNEDVLANRQTPLASLVQLFCILHEAGAPSGMTLKVLGPYESGVLRFMLREVNPGKAPEQINEDGAVLKINYAKNQFIYPPCTDAKGQIADPLKHIAVYDYAATVDDDSLREDLRDGVATARDQFGEAIRFERAIAPDTMVAAALVRELKRRGVDPAHETETWSSRVGHREKMHLDHVALISEWDTYYGQRLPEIVARCFARDCADPQVPVPLAELGNDKPWIHRYRYLRGLDGKLTVADAKTEDRHTDKPGDEANPKTENSRSATAKQLERAEGRSQFDYIRRLGDRIKQLDTQLRRDGEGRISAIGVLGSDVYDKLVVLQVLRRQFPEALFFTTDMDARFMHPSERDWSRNLIIGSSLGLQLRDELQGDIPPFRDNYQTAAFLATRVALDDEHSLQIARNLAHWITRPVVFELGRTRAIALPDPESNAKSSGCGDFWTCEDIRPPTESLFPQLHDWSATFWSVSALLGAAAAASALFGSRRLRRAILSPANTVGTGLWRALFVGALFAATFAGAAVFCYVWPTLGEHLTEYGQGEPILLLEGASIWPTILLRLFVVALCVWLIRHGLRCLDRNYDDISSDLHLRSPAKILKNARKESHLLRWTKVLESFSYRFIVVEGEAPKGQCHRPRYDIAKLWASYVEHGSPHARVVRAAAYTVVILGLSFCLVAFFGMPYFQSRGVLVRVIYEIVTFIDGIAILFLMFFVADATWSCLVFVRALRQIQSKWPESAVKNYGNRLGLTNTVLEEWIDLRFVAMRTECIAALIYYPFIAFALMIISRSDLFGYFPLSWPVLVTQCIALTILVSCAVSLRWAAESSRDLAKRLMDQAITKAKLNDDDGRSAGQLEVMLRRVVELRQGAFTPFSQQPLVRALLLPLGSYGGTTLLQFLTLPGL